MNHKTLLSTLCLVWISLFASAQAPAAEDFRTATSKAFLEYYKHGGVQEKLYLITDKPCYSAGEKVYFSAFLLNPLRFTPAIESAFLYVELISADGRLITRLKLHSQNGRFSNALELPTKLDAGRYTLRAYSKWMTNFDKQFLFRKEIEVGNYIDDAVTTDIRYTPNSDKSMMARIAFRNDRGAAITATDVEYTLNIHGKSKAYLATTDSKGEIAVKFRPSNDQGDCMRIKITANNRVLERTIQLPSFSNDFAVQFMPEGGNLIAETHQTIAFKAIGTDGKSVEVEGYISDNEGNKLCDIKSRHKGMGVFVMTAKAGKHYTATLTSARGQIRTFDLPTPLTTGCTMQVKQIPGNSILMKVSTTPDLPISRLAAVVQSRGVVEAIIEDVSRISRISTANIHSGIAQISIVDKVSKQVVAERLIFIEQENFATAVITTNKPRFSPREKISLNFNIKGSDGRPASGNFVVSVTDSESVQLDPYCENIFSYLLLSSDLHGNIEKPAEYFDKNNPYTKEYLDLIMLTNGWRRYDLSKILKGEYPQHRYKVEDTQRITGEVFGTIGKAKDPSVMIFQKGQKIHGVFPLNKSNRFEITGIDAPDTALYYIQALNRKGHSRSVLIRVDPETYPSTNIPLSRPYYEHYKPTVTESMLMGAKESYYNDGGMRVIDIDAIVVTAKRESQYSYSSVIDSFNSLSGDLTRYASIFDALQRFRQLEVIGTDVRLRKKGSAMTSPLMDDGDEPAAEIATPDDNERVPAVLINGTEADVNSLDMYPLEDVTRLAYIDPSESMGLGTNSANGVIIMEVRDINRTLSTGNESIAKVVVAGYCKPAEFYAPRYDTATTERKKDLRSTIAWEPNLCSDASGRASISFWSADRRNDYNVIIEGITSKGELCRATYRLIAER